MPKTKNNKYLNVVPKAWGKERWIVNRDYCGKILELKKGYRCSYHFHKLKDETFYINKGKVLLEYGGEDFKKAKKIILTHGESKLITPGLHHRFTGLESSEIIEFSTTHRDSDSYRKIVSNRVTSQTPIEKIVSNLNKTKVLVVGDIMLDKYVFSNSEGISEEAPVVVVQISNSKDILGGAANVCNNLRDLEVQTAIVGVIGNDEDGKTIKKLLKESKINSDGIFIDKRQTTRKMRVIAANQQLLRLDYEDKNDVKKTIEDRIYKYFDKVIDDYDAVIISDYNKGMITKNLSKKIISSCKKKKKIVAVDPKPEHASYYEGATIITPNLIEASAMSNIASSDHREIGKKLQRTLRASIVLTLGGQGLMIFEKSKVTKIKVTSKEVYDVSGAGDTVIAVIVAAMATGGKLVNACKLANIAAGIEVSKFGTATVSQDELKDSL